jgi:exosome complex component RRP42
MTTSLSPSERSYILTGLSHPAAPTRLDGRGLLESRPIVVSYGDAPQASGSARVGISGTEVIAGIRLEVEDVDSEEGWRTRIEVDV